MTTKKSEGGIFLWIGILSFVICGLCILWYNPLMFAGGVILYGSAMALDHYNDWQHNRYRG